MGMTDNDAIFEHLWQLVEKYADAVYNTNPGATDNQYNQAVIAGKRTEEHLRYDLHKLCEEASAYQNIAFGASDLESEQRVINLRREMESL